MLLGDLFAFMDGEQLIRDELKLEMSLKFNHFELFNMHMNVEQFACEHL